MVHKLSVGLILSALFLSASFAFAQAVEITEEEETTNQQTTTKTPAAAKSKDPKVGESAARKYFQARKEEGRKPAASSGDRFMAIKAGSFISEELYKWGKNNEDDVGELDLGVAYKIGEWTGSMDLMLNVDLITFDLNEGNPVKLSFMPAIVFPDVDSDFPLYFGAGAGVGVFLKQIEDESSFSLDYSLFTGIRLFDLWQGVGLLFEAGLKNQLLLLSDGQHNGVYLNLGAVFRF